LFALRQEISGLIFARMNPDEPDRPQRRIALYFVVLLAIISASLLFVLWLWRQAPSGGDAFARLMNTGKGYYEQGEALKAVDAFQKAVSLQPTHPDALLNLANACLLAGRSDDAVQFAQRLLAMDPQSAAAYYIAGCAHLRARRFEEAIKSLQLAKDIDRKINAVSLQLGRAQLEAGHYQDAANEFSEIIQFEPDYLSANFFLGQALLRLGRQEEAKQALERHQQLIAGKPNPPADASTFERCFYTQMRVPFELDQPVRPGVTVSFADATLAAFGGGARNFHGPVGVLDINHRGGNDLFAGEGDGGFRVLWNTNGAFQPLGESIPGRPGAKYFRCLIADVNNDRYEDVVAVGDQGIRLFKFGTNGAATDVTRFARLDDVPAVDGALADLDFTGKLDLLLVTPGARNVRVFRNLGSSGGNPYFKEITQTSGVPASVTAVSRLVVDDWNNDDVNDLFLAREAQPSLVLTKLRGGPLTNSPTDWPAGKTLVTGDLNNDLRTDAVIAGADRLTCVFAGLSNRVEIPLGHFRVEGLLLLDYDNDGWLDLCAYGDGVRLWRNLGNAGFQEVTREVGLDRLVKGAVDSIVAADFDGDCDTDLLLSVEGQGLQLLRNEGGSANQQLKLRLIGNRSNASGLGVRVEVAAGRWRTMRTVQSLPIEIGIGKHTQLDSISAHWFDNLLPVTDTKVVQCAPLALIELQLPTGSCPYLYAWDGERFRFVTDILGASPAGLRLTDERFIDADEDELVWLGQESLVRSRAGKYALQITEELREVLYLDAAGLVVVDHAPGTEVHTTGKLLPSKPFPRHEIVTLHNRHPLKMAARSDGEDATAALNETDGRMVSPVKLRIPQLRGLAEPWSVTLDFGPLPVDRPLVLALTGWLRFGGGMANVAASHDANLPFPFPRLEVETAEDQWKTVDVTVGAPCGKTKTILVDLTGKLPAGARRLRLGTSFEIHWDRIALFERSGESETQIARLLPEGADLHWRGFSGFKDLPWYLPLTPDYEKVNQNANWRITPMGWCTRYGDVRELVERRDDALVLLNGGDELTLEFAADRLPPEPAGHVRDFFLYTSGWDKDADFHCERGWLVEPIPWHGMDDQLYGQQQRPVIDGDWWIRKYNARWVGPLVLRRAGR
jgi:tetratricopeptide (TPR) repeat protein